MWRYVSRTNVTPRRHWNGRTTPAVPAGFNNGNHGLSQPFKADSSRAGGSGATTKDRDILWVQRQTVGTNDGTHLLRLQSHQAAAAAIFAFVCNLHSPPSVSMVDPPGSRSRRDMNKQNVRMGLVSVLRIQRSGDQPRSRSIVLIHLFISFFSCRSLLC